MTNAQMHKILVLNNQEIENQYDRKEVNYSYSTFIYFNYFIS
jgi:hypothetical protein